MYLKLPLNHQSSQPDLMTIRSVFSCNQLVSCKLTAESQVLQHQWSNISWTVKTMTRYGVKQQQANTKKLLFMLSH